MGEVSGNVASPMIEFEKVVQGFGKRAPFQGGRSIVLDGVSLTVKRGSILCLLGPSGCGKTTMVNLVMGITVPVSGEVRVMGEVAPYAQARHRIGYMPQDEALYDDITAEENLRFFGAMNGMAGKLLDDRIDEVLAFGRLENDRKKLVSVFSGGMKRRLSLGVALLHDPDLLVLDEPTVGLDPDHRRRIWDEFDAMVTRGKTILLTTHVMDEAARCGEIAMLHAGRIIANASPSDILHDTGTDNLEDAFLALENAALAEGVCHA